jgi:glycine/D-amino acid oxidase-like deaminating enzyme
MKTYNCDIVVVGAGPGGSMAARYCAEGGLDTILIEKWHTRWRDRWCTDTIYQSKRDSIPYTVEVIKEVPARLTWWQQTRLYMANIMIGLLAIVVAFYAVRKRFR